MGKDVKLKSLLQVLKAFLGEGRSPSTPEFQLSSFYCEVYCKYDKGKHKGKWEKIGKGKHLSPWCLLDLCAVGKIQGAAWSVTVRCALTSGSFWFPGLEGHLAGMLKPFLLTLLHSGESWLVCLSCHAGLKSWNSFTSKNGQAWNWLDRS